MNRSWRYAPVLVAALTLGACYGDGAPDTPLTGEDIGALPVDGASPTDTDAIGHETDGGTAAPDAADDDGAAEPVDIAPTMETSDEGDGLADAQAGDGGPEIGDSFECSNYGAPTAAGLIPPTITESSGLVISRTQDNVLWVHNDSGDTPRMYALEPGGERLATVTLSGTYAYDWEDMASGPCEDGDAVENCLYVGDVGDNQRVRKYLKIHRVVEPDVTLGDHTIAADDYDSMTLVYPDEPHDCEALVVDAHGHIYLLTKEWSATKFMLFATPYMPGATEAPLQLLSEHDISDLGGAIGLVTAASFSIPRNRLLVRTYGSAFEYRLPPNATLAELQWSPVFTVPVANEGQGEAIAYGPDGYWHTSEGQEPPIWHILCE